MFFSKHTERVSCRKQGLIYRIYVEGFDEECKENIQIILDFLKELSAGNSAFAETCGDKYIVNKDAILFSEENPRHTMHKMQINFEKVDVQEEAFINMFTRNLFTEFYIFDRAISWEEFVNKKRKDIYFKNGSLLVSIFWKDCDGIMCDIREDHFALAEKFIGQWQGRGFSVKVK